MITIQKNDPIERRVSDIDSKIGVITEVESGGQVFCLIHERYPLSKELCLHRKKLMGTVDEQEWQEYCDYVEECVRRVEESHE